MLNSSYSGTAWSDRPQLALLLHSLFVCLFVCSFPSSGSHQSIHTHPTHTAEIHTAYRSHASPPRLWDNKVQTKSLRELPGVCVWRVLTSDSFWGADLQEVKASGCVISQQFPNNTPSVLRSWTHTNVGIQIHQARERRTCMLGGPNSLNDEYLIKKKCIFLPFYWQ